MSNTEVKPMTWHQLKEVVNSLSEEQLNNPIMYWEEDGGGRISDVECLEEDYVYGEEGSYPISLWEESKGEDETEPTIVYKKGTPVMHTYFSLLAKNMVKLERSFSEQEISKLQNEVHKITGNGEVMQCFNKLLGVNAV